MRDHRKELKLMERESGSVGILPILFVGALGAGTITLFGVTAASGLSKDD